MSAANRNHGVDAVRSIALIGICVVNIPFMAMPLTTMLSPPEAASDRAVAVAVEFLFQAKFFLLFSFVFGWGIEIQSLAAERAGVRFARRFGRRLATLALLGALHALLVFAGDILLLYAILGLLAWPLRRASQRQLLTLAGMMIPLAAASVLALGLLPMDPTTQSPEPGLAGDYLQTVETRLRDWPGTFVFLVLYQGSLAFAAILAGIAAARAGFFEPESSGRRWLARSEPWLIVLGLVGNLIYVLGTSAGSAAEPGPVALGAGMIALGGPAMAAVYLSLILRATANRALPSLLVLAGRNSLSTYVLQGVIAGLVFGGYGLGLFGKLSFAALLPFSLVIALAAMSIVGMIARSFGMGPLEHLLRRATYG